MDIRLDGRTALITGGSEGLGRAMGRKFAESGANVVLVARDPGKLEDAQREIADAVSGTQARVETVSCDVTDPAQIRTAWDSVAGSLGSVDILINNAGATAFGPFANITDEMWQDDLDLKLFAAIRLARLAMPGMAERKWGRIINVLAVSAKTPGAASAPTSVSRAAGLALTKVLAGEGAPDNILVNALLVGLIKSGQHERRHQANAPEKSYEEYLAPLEEKLPMGRFGEAEEFANMACFLVSDAGSYVTGCGINVDGGRSPVV
ncbi:MAG: SDR family oxidoreductase [Alphaproteobacteria bacterium]|nr:SDR family oxidoreductase [Alphaproteobacteria bacterium]